MTQFGFGVERERKEVIMVHELLKRYSDGVALHTMGQSAVEDGAGVYRLSNSDEVKDTSLLQLVDHKFLVKAGNE